MDYAHRTHPQLRLHLSVQGSATNYEAINFYRERFNIPYETRNPHLAATAD
jgi:putative protease